MSFLRRVIVPALIILFAASAFSNVVFAAEPRFHLAANIASYHHDAARNFEEVNPGLGIGFTLPVAGTTLQTLEVGAEIGRYRNSVGGVSTYGTASLDATAVQLTGTTSLRLGAFAGMAHYENASQKFAGGGVPMIGDWVVVGGAQATLRVNDTHDIRVRALPAGKAARILFTFQIAQRF